jgi:hypothetical protein
VTSSSCSQGKGKNTCKWSLDRWPDGKPWFFEFIIVYCFKICFQNGSLQDCKNAFSRV